MATNPSPPPPPLSPCSPISPSDTLPASVEDSLQRICRDHSLRSPDREARLALARLGEAASLQILREIAASRKISSLSGFIIFMARNSTVAMARNAEALSTRESVCFSGPSTPEISSLRDDTLHHKVAPRETAMATGSPISVMDRMEMASPADGVGEREIASPEMKQMELENAVGEYTMRERASRQMLALGELEFRRAFLILSYLGREKLEEKVSVEFINSLKCLPMVQFESKVWGKLGSKYVRPSDRIKILDWYSNKTHVYRCHVDLQGDVTFKGPYLQTTKTHLQRVLGDDNVLLVKFAEMSEENKSPHSFDHYCDVYNRIAEEGIMVGLRRYHFFVYKDGGKEEKKKNPTSSSVKCYFVRMESGWDSDEPYILSDKLVHEARTIFMHVHTVPTVAKYLASYICSALMHVLLHFENDLNGEMQIPFNLLDIDLSLVDVRKIEDIPCTDENGTIVKGKDGEPMIHTDGTGLISEDLAVRCPENICQGKMLEANQPLLIQFRLFYDGYAVKGTFLIDKTLPPRTICIRPSMIKVEPDPSINRPKRSFLSRYLIALLHYGGVPSEYFLDLLMKALEGAEQTRFNTRTALKDHYAEMDDDHITERMISSGVPLSEPFLQHRLSIFMAEQMKGLKGGKIPVDECYYLMGTADPTGTLKPNEVCVILENGQVSGEVLVYKHPGLHFGDMHILTATYIKDLEKIIGNAKYAIFFPIVGRRSLADEMANSDFDGDMYWVSRNPQLLEYFKPSKPWVRTTSVKKRQQEGPLKEGPLKYLNADLERVLFREFLNNRFKPSYAISASADCWLVYMDRLLTPNIPAEEKESVRRKMLRLVDIYYDALDAPKTGLKVEVPSELYVKKYPHFMGRRDEDSYNSTSILGLIYDKVMTFHEEKDGAIEIWQLPCFTTEEVPQPCFQLWNNRYSEYLQEMSQLCQMKGGECNEFKDSVFREIFRKYKQMLYGAADYEERARPRNEIFNEALAIYSIAYNKAKNDCAVGRCGFAWKVAGEALCELYIKKMGLKSINCAHSILREIVG
ncbi:putative RNA-dependent RNA polymerase 3 [Ananas comosus]|uniref:RNA-dependent RNA polymerase n=1 Tax=Ananas comosus TaxID=4615 RepID=A0A199W539_ANACO|nr:putative RNA-dependent RNA polymerase 3 [Ananas comosus]